MSTRKRNLQQLISDLLEEVEGDSDITLEEGDSRIEEINWDFVFKPAEEKGK